MAKVYHFVTGLSFLLVLCGSSEYLTRNSPVPSKQLSSNIPVTGLSPDLRAKHISVFAGKKVPGHIGKCTSNNDFGINNFRLQQCIPLNSAFYPLISGSLAIFYAALQQDGASVSGSQYAPSTFFIHEKLISGFYAYHAFW